jgi:hypothetical protein
MTISIRELNARGRVAGEGAAVLVVFLWGPGGKGGQSVSTAGRSVPFTAVMWLWTQRHAPSVLTNTSVVHSSALNA